MHIFMLRYIPYPENAFGSSTNSRSFSSRPYLLNVPKSLGLHTINERATGATNGVICVEVSGCPWGCVGSSSLLLGYKEEGMLAASFSVGWTVPLQGKVLSVSDCCPTAVSFAAVAAVVAVAWLLSLPLT